MTAYKTTEIDPYLFFSYDLWQGRFLWPILGAIIVLGLISYFRARRNDID